MHLIIHHLTQWVNLIILWLIVICLLKLYWLSVKYIVLFFNSNITLKLVLLEVIQKACVQNGSIFIHSCIWYTHTPCDTWPHLVQFFFLLGTLLSTIHVFMLFPFFIDKSLTAVRCLSYFVIHQVRKSSSKEAPNPHCLTPNFLMEGIVRNFFSQKYRVTDMF